MVMSTPIEAQLDEILATAIETSFIRGINATTLHGINNTDESLKWAHEIELPKAKDKLIDLFAHLASEAKPERDETDNDWRDFHNIAIDTFEINILKALGREA